MTTLRASDSYGEFSEEFIAEVLEAELDRLSDETRADPVSWDDFKAKLGL